MKMQRDGLSQVVATVKMCLTAGGSVKNLTVLKSSGLSVLRSQDPEQDAGLEIPPVSRRWKTRAGVHPGHLYL